MSTISSEGLRKGLGDWFNRKLLHEQIGVLITDLGTITSGLFQLADAQRNLAWTLNREQKKLHQTLLREALKQLGHPELSDLSLGRGQGARLGDYAAHRTQDDFPR